MHRLPPFTETAASAGPRLSAEPPLPSKLPLPGGRRLSCPEKEVEPVGSLWVTVKWPGSHQLLEVFCLQLFHSFTLQCECAFNIKQAKADL